MHYSSNDIQKIYETTKGKSMTEMSEVLVEAFPELLKGTPFKATNIKDSPEEIPFAGIGIAINVLTIAVNSLAAFLLTKDNAHVSHIVMNHAKQHADKGHEAWLAHIAKWVQGTDHRSVANLTHLAYYEAEIRFRRKVSFSNMVLPGDEEVSLITQLAKALMNAMGNPAQVLYRVDTDIEYNEVVKEGEVDFLVGDTLYITRLGRAYKRDRYLLLIAYLMVKQSEKYKDHIINHVSLVCPSEGVCNSVDIREVDETAMGVVADCIFGPQDIAVVETTISRKRRVTLAMSLVSLFDAKSQDAVIDELTLMCNMYLSSVKDEIDDPKVQGSFLAASSYFGKEKPLNVGDETYYMGGINLLNQLLVDIENIDEPESQVVRLSDELANDILSKALDF